MPLPKSIYQPLRKGQLMVGSGWRAYFAPFNSPLAAASSYATVGPTIYDLLTTGKFLDASSGPPSGWFDLGLIRDFTFTPGSKIGNVTAGYRNVIKAKYRGDIGMKMHCVFRESTRMAIKVATGCQVFNALAASGAVSTTGPLSASGNTAGAIGASGYVASGSVVGYVGEPALYVTSTAGLSVGDYIVCDQDYNGSDFGYVGDAGANVFEGAVTDTDFIRKTSDYVACIKAIVGSALVLTGKFVGGGNKLTGTPNTAPTAGAKVQKITGFGYREGGTSITEWSAIFVMDTMDRNQFLHYFPHVGPDSFVGLPGANLQNVTSLQEHGLEANFEALGFDDPLDGETVTSYLFHYPAAGLNIQN